MGRREKVRGGRAEASVRRGLGGAVVERHRAHRAPRGRVEHARAVGKEPHAAVVPARPPRVAAAAREQAAARRHAQRVADARAGAGVEAHGAQALGAAIAEGAPALRSVDLRHNPLQEGDEAANTLRDMKVARREAASALCDVML